MCEVERERSKAHTNTHTLSDAQRAVPEEVLFIIPNPVKGEEEEEAKSLYYTGHMLSGNGAITETKLR